VLGDLCNPRPADIANSATTNGCCSWLLLDPMVLSTSGTHSVVIDPIGSGVGTVVVRLFDIHGTITPDAPAIGVTASNGQPFLLEFQAAAGQRFTVTAEKTSGSLGCAWLGMRTASWANVPQLEGVCTFQMVVSEPLAGAGGVYFVVVDPSGTNTGSADVRLYSLVDHTGTIAPEGPPVEVTLVTPGQRALLTFNGTAGQRISSLLDLIGGSMGGCGGSLEIQKPDETFFSPSAPSCGGGTFAFHDVVELLTPGTYTVIVNPGLASLPTVSVRVYDVPPDVTGTMTFGVPFALTFVRPGQNGALTFAGVNGQRIVMAASNETITGHLTFGCDILTEIRRPDGDPLSGSSTCMELVIDGFMDVKTLPVPGTYTVEIDPNTAATGG
jgi:hypothetical protein